MSPVFTGSQTRDTTLVGANEKVTTVRILSGVDNTQLLAKPSKY